VKDCEITDLQWMGVTPLERGFGRWGRDGRRAIGRRKRRQLRGLRYGCADDAVGILAIRNCNVFEPNNRTQ